MKSGIYLIKNTINGKPYIGSTKNFRVRFNKHKSDLRNNNHSNDYLQNSWNKYGENNFEFEILNKVRENYIHQIEQKYLDFLFDNYDHDKFYNIKKKVEPSEHNEEILEKISKKNSKDKIELVCKNCNDTFKVKPCREDTANYCSRDCWDRSGKNNPSWNGGKEKRECKNCGSNFKAHEGVDKKCCSKKCFKDILSKNSSGKNNPMYGVNGSDSPNSKINEQTALEIKRLLKSTNMTHKQIADKVGTTHHIVCSINNDRSWTHISLKHQEDG